MFEILVNVEEIRDDNPVVKTGLALASRHSAYATGLNIVEVYPSIMAIPDVVTALAQTFSQARKPRLPPLI